MFFIPGIRGVLGTHRRSPQPYPSSVFLFRLLVGAEQFAWSEKEECRGSSQLENKMQGKESVGNPKWQGKITCSWRWHPHPAPGSLSVKHVVCALSFSQGQTLVLTLLLAFLSLSDFPLILFSFYLAFTGSQTPCHNAAAGSCYRWYSNITSCRTPPSSCLCLELYCCAVLTTFPLEIAVEFSFTHGLCPYFSSNFHPNKD